MFVEVQSSFGTVTKLTLPVNNRDGKIGQLRAFAVRSLSELVPLGDSARFPAA